MKLIIAIVNKDDSADVAQRLSKSGFMSTRLSTTGGFLRAGNGDHQYGDRQLRGAILLHAPC